MCRFKEVLLIRNLCGILNGKRGRKGLLKGPIRKWTDNFKTGLIDTSRIGPN
jgi:hypothetical protein